MAVWLVTMIVPFALLVLFLLAIVWSASVIWRTARGWEFRRSSAQCAKCEYPVEGLVTWTCPECGSDLLQVGILGSQQDLKRRNLLTEAIAGWCVLSLMAAVAVIAIFALYDDADQAAVVFFSVWLGLTAIGSGVIMLLRRSALRRKHARETAHRMSRKPPAPPPTAPPPAAASNP